MENAVAINAEAEEEQPIPGRLMSAGNVKKLLRPM
jgi:hypothetical protein